MWRLCLLTLVMFCGLVGSQIPDNPCPEVFSYKLDGRIYYGDISIPYDGSRNLDLAINVSMAGQYQNVKLKMDLRTPSEETLSIPILECRVNFPLQNVIPKIMQITFNGRSRCIGIPEPVTSNGVTYLWANIVHSSSEYSYDFQSDFLSSLDLLPSKDVTNCIPISKPSQPKPTQTQSNARICGISVASNSSANSLLANDNLVPLGAFPWLTAVFESTGKGLEYRCCGSLVSNKHVITGANCLHEGRQNATLVSPTKLLLVLGKHNIENLLIRDDEKVVGARDIKIHPDYVPLSPDADIAVVILAQEVAYTNFIKPICVWFDSNVYTDSIVSQTGKVVGWETDENNGLNAEPRQTTFKVVSQKLCLRSAEVLQDITSQRSFCAVEENNFGPCRNKRGSGFMMKQNGRWILRGIVSTNHYNEKMHSCDLSNFVVYTDVSKFRTWLQSIITF